MEVEDIIVHVRPYENDDRNFVFKTWLRSFRGYRAKSPDEMYYPNQQQLIDDIFQRSTARCVVACDSNDPSFIFAFFVAEKLVTLDPREPLIVHFGFTKLSYRNQGMATYCLKALGWHPGRTVHVTHWTRFCKEHREQLLLMENDYFLRGYEHGRFATYQPARIQTGTHPSVGPVPAG